MGWSLLCVLSTVVLILVAIPHAISSHADVAALWDYLRQHHLRTWIQLGGRDSWSELLTERGFGSFRKVYPVLEKIDDPELHEHIERIKRHERFASRVLVPLFFVTVMLFVGRSFS